MFKKSSQLSDLELRAAFESLAGQVDTIEKVLVAMIGMLLAREDEWDAPPEDVYRSMVEMLEAYSQQIVDVQKHLEEAYAQEVARNN